jgi:hypothetical protein
MDDLRSSFFWGLRIESCAVFKMREGLIRYTHAARRPPCNPEALADVIEGGF